ncbi:MAG TPA: DUF3857 and transglutaminase domain-containing protein [Longimicrobiales bacterium]|nr:DUF3857 and transglutaminase domain-containing protein [Longimicrobiales bacterium]
MPRPTRVPLARAAALSLLLAGPPSPALAQDAPEPLPPGLAFPDDSIRALAAEPADYPEERAIYLLVEGATRQEPDGTGERTYRFVQRALVEEAVRGMAERRVTYDADRQEFVLHWARVLDGEGNVVSEEPIHVQEGDEPVPTQSPIYTARKRVSISLGGLAAGHSVDYAYTIRQLEPAIPGDYWLRRAVRGGATVRRYRYLLDVPTGTEPRIVEENLRGPARVTEEGGRRLHEWRFAELERIESEPFAADSNGVSQTILVAPARAWQDVAHWYAGLTEDRYVVTPELEAKLAEVTAGATTLADSLRALHRWVAQDIRYVSISLGLGGYQPRLPTEVVSTASGDCKDKTTLFIALARHMGVDAHPVLVQTGGAVRPGLPSGLQFNHMVAAFRLAGERHYLDLTVPYAPFGEVYGGLQGKHGVLLGDDGSAEVVTFPKSPASANRSVIAATGTLDEDGRFEGRYLEEVTGAVQYRIRSEFAGRQTERRLEGVASNIGNRVFDGAKGDSLVIFDGRDLTAVPRLEARVTAEDVLRSAPGGHILPLKLPRYGSRSALEALERERRFPIDAEKVFGRREHVTELRFTLPDGWSAHLPDDVRAESAFGLYESTYEQQGRDLVIRRVVRGTDGIHPPEARDELIAWFEAMLADDVQFVVLSP